MAVAAIGADTVSIVALIPILDSLVPTRRDLPLPLAYVFALDFLMFPTVVVASILSILTCSLLAIQSFNDVLSLTLVRVTYNAIH